MENSLQLHDIDKPARLMAMAALGVDISCRVCGSEFSERNAKSFVNGKRVLCGCCGWFGTWRSNTLLSNSTISDVQFLALFYRFSLPAKHKEIAGLLGVADQTVRLWEKKIADLTRNKE